MTMIDKGKFLDYLLKAKNDKNINLTYDEWERFVWLVLNFKELSKK